MSERYSRKPNTACLVCATPVYRRPAEITRSGGNVFCSSTCYGKHSRKEHPCIVCGAPIQAHMHKKTCSRACANTTRTGTTYDTSRPRDKVKDQHALKTRLFEKRGKKCERCGYALFQILQVHHKDRDPTNNTLKNVVLLCPNCHATEHYFKKSWLNGTVVPKS